MPGLEFLRDALTQVGALLEAFASQSTQHQTLFGFRCMLFGDMRIIDRESDTETFVELKDRQALLARGQEQFAVGSLPPANIYRNYTSNNMQSYNAVGSRPQRDSSPNWRRRKWASDTIGRLVLHSRAVPRASGKLLPLESAEQKAIRAFLRWLDTSMTRTIYSLPTSNNS